MNKVDLHSSEIKKNLSSGDYTKLEEYLIEESGLPGPRANLELTKAFYSEINEGMLTDDVWQLLINYFNTPASTNEPKVMLPFCSIHAFGNIFLSVDKSRQQIIYDKILDAMNDERWRIREAAADCCQIIAEQNTETIVAWFDKILPSSSILEKRCIIASLAHPPILDNDKTNSYCINICGEIFKYISQLPFDVLKSSDYEVLKKGMEYAPSVFVQASPDKGFKMLMDAANLKKPHVDKLIKSNLSKGRLKKYTEEIGSINEIIN